MGCFTQLIPALAAGAKIVLLRKWDAAQAVELIQREEVTHFTGVPSVLLQTLDEVQSKTIALTKLKSLAYGGAPHSPELAAQTIKAFPNSLPSMGYGLTETSAVVTMIVGQDGVDHPGSSGIALPVVDVKIVDADENELAIGGVGEIWVRSPGVIKGYWNNPAATSAAKVNGWIRTGDLGRFDDENFLYVLDRAKDMIIRGGENIYCVEVENAILEHPNVKDAAVIGIPHPILGEEVAAAVEILPDKTIAESALREYLTNRLAAFKIPVKFDIRKTPLPRSVFGKLMKRDIRLEILGKP
jgi:long-chain acyl-CoA synthetase